MKITAVETEPVRYALRQPIRTGSGAITARTGLRISVVGADGRRGRGEALPLPSAGTESLAAATGAIRAFAETCLQEDLELDTLLDLLETRLPDAPAARCGLDVALHDLEARQRRVPVARLLAESPCREVGVNALVGAARTAETVARACAAVAQGFRTLKLKLGREPGERDVARVMAVRRAVGRDVRLRIDPNGAWSPEQALALLERLAPCGIELVEQPVAARDLAGLRQVREKSPIPVAADECLATGPGRAALIRDDIASIAVLKPMVLGGLRASARLARRARQRGLRCLVTTTLDGAIATRAAVHLAAAIPDTGLDHGVGGQAMAGAVPPDLVPVAGVLPLGDGWGLGGEDES